MTNWLYAIAILQHSSTSFVTFTQYYTAITNVFDNESIVRSIITCNNIPSFNNWGSAMLLLSLVFCIVVFILLVAGIWAFCIVYSELSIISSNFGIPRAKHCSPRYCGFYHHEIGCESMCLCPSVRKSFFKRQNRKASNPGCPYSFQLEEPADNRRPANDYCREWLEIRRGYLSKSQLIYFIMMFVFGMVTGVGFNKVVVDNILTYWRY